MNSLYDWQWSLDKKVARFIEWKKNLNILETITHSFLYSEIPMNLEAIFICIPMSVKV